MKALLRRPALGGALLLGVSWILVRPAGDYPLNDDWVFARATKIFVETWHLQVDAVAAPSLVGQILLAAPFVKAFGFSHRLLRAVTMGVALIGLWALDAIASACEVTLVGRWVLALVVAANPLYLYLSTTYMNDLFGWVPALIAAAIWFRARRAQPDGGPLVGFAHALAVGALAGGAFWCRQFACLVFPALLLSGLWPLVRQREWPRLRASAPALLAASALFAVVVGAYFPWARATRNLSPAFTDPAAHLLRLNPKATLFEAGSLVVYLTAFLAPALGWLTWSRPRLRAVACAAVFVALAFAAHRLCQTLGGPDTGEEHVHRQFPYVGNIIYNAGIGPITMQESYAGAGVRPRWNPQAWKLIEGVIFAALALWLPFFQGAIASKTPRHRELVLFGAALAALNFLAFSQAFQTESFDRYYLASFLGLALAVASGVPAQARGLARAWFCVPALLSLLFFGVAGVHDEFRWNDARWRLVNVARSKGVDVSNIQAGYEPAGWLTLDAWTKDEPLKSCAGPCSCVWGGFYCRDDSVRVGMQVLPGYRIVGMETPFYWLARGPPLYLQVRQWQPEPSAQ